MPLGDVDPNVRRRLRSSSTATKAAPPRPVKRPRGRPPTLFGLIEPVQQRLPEGLRPRGHPQIPPIIVEPSVEILRLRGRPTTLSNIKTRFRTVKCLCRPAAKLNR